VAEGRVEPADFVDGCASGPNQVLEPFTQCGVIGHFEESAKLEAVIFDVDQRRIDGIHAGTGNEADK
jgi:hypothetical protein